MRSHALIVCELIWINGCGSTISCYRDGTIAAGCELVRELPVASPKLASPRAGNLMVSPYFFSPKKLTTSFSHRPLQSDFLAAVSSQLPPSDVICPAFFLHSAAKIISFGVSPPDDVTRGGPLPSRPLVTPLRAASANLHPAGSWERVDISE